MPSTTPAFNGGLASSPQSIADAATLSGFADSVSFTRSFWPNLKNRYPDLEQIQNGVMANILGNKGMVGVPENTTQVFHGEQDSVMTTVNVISFTGGAAPNAPATLTVTADTFGATPLYTNYATIGQIFQVANEPTSLLQVVSPISLPIGVATHTITVIPATGGTINSFLSAGDTLLPQDSAFAEGDEFPDGSTRAWIRYGVDFQYLMTASPEVGTSTYNQTFEFQFEGMNGQPSASYLAPKIFGDVYLRNLMQVSVAACKGQGVLFAGKQQTTGYITAAEALGVSFDVIPGGFQEDDFNNMSDLLVARGASSNVEVWGGFSWCQSTQANNASLLTNGALQYLSGEQNNAPGNVQIKKAYGRFQWGSFTYSLNEATEWRNKSMYSPIVAGVQNQADWINSAWFNTDEKVVVPKGLTNGSYDVDRPQFRLLYLMSPVTANGPKTMLRVFTQDPVHFGKEIFKMTMAQNFAAQSMLAVKTGFVGAA